MEETSTPESTPALPSREERSRRVRARPLTLGPQVRVLSERLRPYLLLETAERGWTPHDSVRGSRC